MFFSIFCTPFIIFYRFLYFYLIYLISIPNFSAFILRTMSLSQIASRITPFGFSHPSAWKTFCPLLPDRTVSSDRDHLPWQPFSARFKGTFCRHLKSSATWNLHADNSDTLHLILPDDLCQFNGIIGAVKFRTSHQHHTIFKNSSWNFA